MKKINLVVQILDVSVCFSVELPLWLVLRWLISSRSLHSFSATGSFSHCIRGSLFQFGSDVTLLIDQRGRKLFRWGWWVPEFVETLRWAPTGLLSFWSNRAIFHEMRPQRAEAKGWCDDYWDSAPDDEPTIHGVCQLPLCRCAYVYLIAPVVISVVSRAYWVMDTVCMGVHRALSAR